MNAPKFVVLMVAGVIFFKLLTHDPGAVLCYLLGMDKDFYISRAYIAHKNMRITITN